MSLKKLFPDEESIQSNPEDEGRTVTVPINNMAEYQELIELAENQLNDLKDTLYKLKYFDINMKITF